jgi:hypothetical protein
VREYKDIAAIYKIKTAETLRALKGKLAPQYQLSLEIIFHLYLKIYDRIDPDAGTFSTEELNPTPEEIRSSVLECLAGYKREFYLLFSPHRNIGHIGPHRNPM